MAPERFKEKEELPQIDIKNMMIDESHEDDMKSWMNSSLSSNHRDTK